MTTLDSIAADDTHTLMTLASPNADFPAIVSFRRSRRSARRLRPVGNTTGGAPRKRPSTAR
jgi:hypothetical protein